MSGGPNQRIHTRQAIDLHETPSLAVRALLRVEPLPGLVWDPCCGPGSIVSVLRQHGHSVVASDVTDYEWGQDAVYDFLSDRRLPPIAEAIVMNPPYNQAADFVSRALDLVPHVYALLRLNFYAAVRKDYPNLYDRFRALHVFNRRLPMMHRAGWAGKKASSQFDHAWFVWGPNLGHSAIVDQIDWKQP